jgi:hypothetical protein
VAAWDSDESRPSEEYGSRGGSKQSVASSPIIRSNPPVRNSQKNDETNASTDVSGPETARRPPHVVELRKLLARVLPGLFQQDLLSSRVLVQERRDLVENRA